MSPADRARLARHPWRGHFDSEEALLACILADAPAARRARRWWWFPVGQALLLAGWIAWCLGCKWGWW